jgi:uncharacterized membrane protein YfcA
VPAPETLLPLVGALLAALFGGAVNSIAGGGSILTFPALLALGLGPIEANATSAVALWPSGLGGALGLREALRVRARRWVRLAPLALVGGLVGALVLLETPPTLFVGLAPGLILFATLLLALRKKLSLRLAARAPSRARSIATGLGIFGVSAYGGYFGAGMGLLLLVALGFALSGEDAPPADVLELNAAKNLMMLLSRGTAAAWFAVEGRVDWTMAALMAAGALAGGLLGARLLRWLGPARSEALIVGLGVAIAALLAGKALGVPG